MVNVLEFKNLQEAWLGVNKFIAFNEDKILKDGGEIVGTELLSYNNLVVVDNLYLDPNFDFGEVLGYHIKKWTTLIRNYVDFGYLDLLKSEINKRLISGSKKYSYAFHFSNKYGGGKDCLLSLVFLKKVNQEIPTVHFYVRMSEVTCRLIFDFLLVKRICEYVYGKNYPIELHFHAPAMFITAERFSILAHNLGYEENIEPNLGKGRFSNRIRKTCVEFQTIDTSTISYKSHKKCADIIQGIKPAKSMKAKTLPLTSLLKDLPKDIITLKQLKTYLKAKKQYEVL